MYTEHNLKNGMKVIMSKLDVYRSVSIGFWVKTGSINEEKETNGISHFIEHMLFKGTENRSAKDIAESFDAIGGDLNAFTSKECTCFHARVLDDNLKMAIEIISDMIINSNLLEEEIDKERNVIIDEINLSDDSPDDLSYDLISKVIFDESPLSLPILGTVKSVNNINKEVIINYMNKFYTPDNIIISVAGSIDKEKTLSLLEDYIGHYNILNSVKTLKNNKFNSSKGFIYKDIEQIHLELSYKGLSYSDEDLFSLAALNNILGASVSSRLFQTIREEHGLTYSINSYVTQYENIGLFSIYASMYNSNLFKVIKLIKSELDNIVKSGVTEEEVVKVKKQLKGNYILDLEGSENYMNLLGKSYLFKETINTVDEVEKKIESITRKSVLNLIERILNTSDFSIGLVGKVDDNILDKCIEILKS